MNVITIREGNVLRSVATFTNDAGVPINPGAVTFVYQLNDDPTTTMTLTYAAATLPEPGLIANTAVGVFEAQVSLTGLSGSLTRYWLSTGVGQAASEPETFAIPTLPF